MPTATVTVSYVNPPKPGKKMGSIKCGDVYYGVWPDKLSLFQAGQTYNIEYTEDNGFKNFKKLANGASSGHISTFVPKAAASHKSDAKAEEMFVMGFMNRCYQGACSVPSQTQLVSEMLTLRNAWRFVWDEKQAEQPIAAAVPSEELNDEIPF